MRLNKRRFPDSFNPRTYIRYDPALTPKKRLNLSFNPRTYIRYDPISVKQGCRCFSFNPRTYIRYDTSRPDIFIALSVSIHVPI